jgi:RHS repeat-associated protein
MNPLCFAPLSSRALRLFPLALMVLLLLAVSAAAQTYTTTSSDRLTPIGLKAGAPAGSYSLSGAENINLYNGNLDFRLPLLQMGGRGSAGHSIVLALNTKGWIVKSTASGESFTYTPSHSTWGSPYTGYAGGKLEGRKSGFGLKTNISQGCVAANVKIYNSTFTTLTFTAADGTEYDFRDAQTGGQNIPVVIPPCPSFPYYTGALRGKVWVTTDGNAATFTSDVDIYDQVNIPMGVRLFHPSGYMVMRDGTTYRIDGGQVSWIRDRNGNKVTFNGSVITDSIGRTATVAHFENDPTYGICDLITYKGFGGADRSIYVTWTTLSSSTLRSDQTLKTLGELFPQLNGALNSGSGLYQPYIASSVILPDGRSYQFRYNSYGELARVILPTGGAIDYDMVPGSGVVQGNNGQGDVYEIYRRVAERRTYENAADAATLTNRTVYTAVSGQPVKVEQFDAAGTLLSSSKHYFVGDPVEGMFQQIESEGYPTQLYPNPLDGREEATEVYNVNGVTATSVLQTVVNYWQTGTTLGSFPVNPRISAVTTTLNDLNLVSKKTFLYDQCTGCNSYFNNQTDVYEYDYGSGAPGSLVRRSHTDYLVTNPINSADYTLAANNIHLRSLPTQQFVYDSGDTLRAKTSFEYDNYNADTTHAGLVTRYSISGLCDGSSQCPGGPNFADANYQTRGNVTATTRYLLNTSGGVTGSISTFAQYDVAGNVVKAIDGRSCATTVDYTDRFGTPDGEARSNPGPTALGGQVSYAFATSITNCLGHTVYGQFDYYLGQAVDGEDANGVVASGYFNDVLERPTKIVRAANQDVSVKSQTTFSYDDTGRTITTTSDQATYAGNGFKSQVVYDRLGRTTESRTYEDSTNYITVNTQYDALGRAYKTSNPYRPWQGEVAIWTTSAFDALGRVTSVTTPDSAVVSSNYSGNTVTVTDQTGKARKSVTDGLGRLTQVNEDPAGLNYLTSYSYDTLDNLTGVSQVDPNTQYNQTRTFVYDSLKRLTSATNPESGTVCYGTVSGGQCQANGYDANGNLVYKTDARGVLSTYVYDLLNRNTSITYSNDPNGTLPVTRVYDLATNGKGRLYQSQTTGAAGSLMTIDDYDVNGRPHTERQQFFVNGAWSQSYTVTRGYNLAGAVTSQTYPSGRSVSYTYDNAGRTTGFSGYLGDNVNRSYATEMLYSSLGGMVKERFGTDTAIYNKLFYNSRGQLAEIREGTYNATDGTWWNRGAIINHYSESCWGACGGSNSTTAMTDNNGNLKKQDVYIPNDDQISSPINWWQQYSYDSLNRLSWVREISGSTELWKQAYDYDRYGNRTINQSGTWGPATGPAINKKDFTVNTANNRLGIPGGQSGTMTYDSAGNLTVDTYSAAAVLRSYDAESRMTKETQPNSVVAGEYTYNADGQRVRRKVNGVETWQVYGFDGELLAEYAANGAAASPQKEYGYRNGQLLITAAVISGSGGTAYTFTDDPLVVNVTSVKAVHLTELRAAVDQARAHAGLSAASWAESISSGVTLIKASHITELRARLAEARTALGLSAASYTDPNLTIGDTIKAAHIQELRGKANETITVGGGTTTTEINWLVADQLGTPRMIFDKTGSLTNTKRHDYLPFGEELFVGTGGRTPTQGYAADTVRQKFTQKERDIETGLDYFGARYFASAQGRFTSVDPLMASGLAVDPQSWNRYAHVNNNPLRYVDDEGLLKRDSSGNLIFEAIRTDTARHQGSGESVTVEVGYLTTDNGAKILAFKPDGSNYLMDTDCHGLTFGDGQYLIDNSQVKTLLEGDGYKKTNEPQVGDVAIYTSAQDGIVHSTTVVGVDAQGNVTEVAGLGGIQVASSTTSPRDAWPYNEEFTITYYHKAKDKRTEQQRQDNLRRTQTYNKHLNKVMRDFEKEYGKPPKAPKVPKKKEGR